MAGGVDGFQTYSPQLFPSITTALTLKRYAQVASTHIVEYELGKEGGLLSHISLSDTPDSEVFVTQLDELRLRLHGKEATMEWRAEIVDLDPARQEICERVDYKKRWRDCRIA